MNLELMENFGQNYPEDFDGALDCFSMALVSQFNRQGTLLAVGCNDGRLVIWDFLTRGIAKSINAHVHPICSLSWTRNGRRIVSASTDNCVCVWDVLSGDCVHKFRFPSPVLKVMANPRNSQLLLVCPLKHSPVKIEMESGQHSILPLDDDGDPNVIASFDRRGKYIYTGNSRGRICVLSTKSFKTVASFRITAGSNIIIKSIEFARRGNSFLVNSSDRIIRIYDTKEVLECGKDGEPEPVQKLQDLVNKTLWKKCCFSGDGEYIVAGSARQHSLYIWEKSIGNLVKILHGTKGEVLLDVVWHPVRPTICSISAGLVSIWAQSQVENWSAFAPDFKELEENLEYEERESEFDLEDEDNPKETETKDFKAKEEDVDIDVTTCEPIAAFCSSDEEDGVEEDALLFLPVAPDIDDPDEGGASGVPGTSWGSLLGAGAGGGGSGDLGAGENSTEIGVSSNKKRPTYGGLSSSSSPLDSKRKKLEEVKISLPNAPSDSEHPLLNPKMEKPQKVASTKQSGNGGGRGRPRLNDDGGGGGGAGGGGSSRKRKEKY